MIPENCFEIVYLTMFPDSVLKELYPGGVYIIPENQATGIPVSLPQIEPVETEETILTAAPEIHFYGQNRKKILFLVDDNSAEFLNDKDKVLLTKILEAINLSYADIALLNVAKYPEIRFKVISEKTDFKKAFLFGVPASQMFDREVKMQEYKFTEIDDIEVLSSVAFSVLQDDVPRKKLLWAELKQVFAS
jgi:hypothetical protein